MEVEGLQIVGSSTPTPLKISFATLGDESADVGV